MDDECVGCNLCVNVCPVENCITMVPLAAGAMDQRTGKVVDAGIRQLDDASEQPGAGWRRSKPVTEGASAPVGEKWLRLRNAC